MSIDDVQMDITSLLFYDNYVQEIHSLLHVACDHTLAQIPPMNVH